VAIEKSINEQGKMTDELRKKLDHALTLTELEDIYLPYKPKRKTKAQAAREKGLEPLALLILEQKISDPGKEAAAFISEEVKTTAEALQGARDIIAELVNEQETVRSRMRRLFEETARLESHILSGKEETAAKFKDYFDYAERFSDIPSHRILAVLRGFMEGLLRISIAPNEEEALQQIEPLFINSSGPAAEEIRKAIKDSYRRLLQPGLESEFRMALKTRADEEAINVFAENLRQLLLGSPLGSKKVLAIDPGYRTGCKLVCLNEQGDLQKTDLIFIHEAGRLQDAELKVRDLVNRFGIQAIAIGDGTAGRETEAFIKKLGPGIPIFLVNEDGASVYSASETAREEFPDQDITVRGAVSIGRRLMDPLAELVKIDPKSIGVGQYQHDVNQFRLKEKLDQTVISCVNAVGVNLNTSGKYLLRYVSGIGETLAENIVKYRTEIGRFSDRKQLLKVNRLGEKAFEQCAGFLRIEAGGNPLDNSSVHPEAYPVVEKMAKDLGVPVGDLIGQEALINRIDLKKYIGAAVGEHTVRDILNELRKPGLDPRSELESFEFANIFKIEDVLPGMIVPGIVTNITRFGAFVDIGVKQDGLVHVSEIAHRYISDPGEALKLNDKVKVKVLEVDLARKRIALSIKQAQEPPAAKQKTAKVSGKRAEAVSGSMEEALSALKKKFR
ncbi:MAG TPA: Tex family protein, partial [Puia sp.]|nr:Tex family protein [Puia sp.]